MGEKYSVTAVLSAIDRNFSAVMQKASDSMAIMKAKAETISPAIKNTGKVMAGAGALITAASVKSVESFGQFEQEINKAAVIAGGSSKDIRGLSDEAARLGSTLPISAQDAAAAMTEMARNGASVKDLKNDFPPIAQAAASAGEDLSNTATVVQQSMNLWGGGMQNATKYSAILTETANKSNASIGDMQQVLADVGGTATNMGISLSNVATAAGIMTNSGIPAAQGAQELNHALLAMEAPSDVAQAKMSELGLSFSDANGKAKPLPNILKDVAKATDGMGQSQKAAALKAMFGTAGMNAMIPLLKSVNGEAKSGNTDWKTFAGALESAGGSYSKASKYLSGSTNQMQKNVGSQLDQLKDSFSSLSIASNQASSDGIQKFLVKLQDVVGYLTTSKDGIAVFTRGLIAMAPVLGPIALGIGGILIVISKLISAASTIGAVLANPWFLVIAAVIAVGTALWAFFTKTEKGKKIWKSLTDFMMTVWNTISPILISIWNTLSQTFIGIWEAVAPLLKTIWDIIVQVFNAVAPIIMGILTTIGNVIMAVFGNPIFQITVMALLLIITQVFSAIGAFITITMSLISNAISTGLQIISIVWNTIWTVISTVVSTVWNVIKIVITTAMNVIKNIIKLGTSLMRGDWNGAMQAIKGIASSIWNGIKGIISVVIGAIKTIISAGIKAAKGIWQATLNGMKNIVDSVWKSIKNFFQSGIDFIKKITKVDLFKNGSEIINGLWNGMKSVWESVKNWVGGIADWIKKHKGPISYDRKLLIPAGNAIMLGLNEGLTKQFKTVQSNVTSMAGQIADSVQNATPILDTKSISNGFNRIQSLSASAFSGNINSSMTLNASTMDQQNNRLLQKLVDKNQDIYVDRDRWVGATSDAYDGALGNNSNNNERWRM